VYHGLEDNVPQTENGSPTVKEKGQKRPCWAKPDLDCLDIWTFFKKRLKELKTKRNNKILTIT